jgi:hypothetical protein
LFGSAFLLTACGSFVEIRDEAKLSQNKLQEINDLPIYEQREVKRGSYKSLGDFHGYSCKNKIWDKPATKSDAMKQLKIKASSAGANAVILDSCYGEGTTYSKNCWEAFTCSGAAVVLQSDSLIASTEEQNPAAKTATVKFPDTPTNVSFRAINPRPNDVAVIIANADYSKGKDIPDVVPAYADAEGIKKYATEALGISSDNIIFIKDATQAEMTSTFGSRENFKGQLFDWVEPGKSQVFVYYAGHGAPGVDGGNSYLVPVNAQASRISLNGYSLQTLYQNLSKLPAKSVTVVLEACFSGASQGGSVITNASPVYLNAKETGIPSNLTVIAAGAANEIASWEEDKSHSLFTKYFLKGMSGEADAAPQGNVDGAVGWNELKRYLKTTLTKSARRYYGRNQTAQIIVGTGE